MQKIYSRFNLPESKPVMPVGPSLTQQQFKDDADINKITARYIKTNVLGTPGGQPRQPIFGDFTSIDFQTMQNTIADVEQNFNSLPSRIRNRFKNSPYQLIRFVEQPENRSQAIKLGLVDATREEIDENEQKIAIDALKDKKMPIADDEANPNKKPVNPA